MEDLELEKSLNEKVKEDANKMEEEIAAVEDKEIIETHEGKQISNLPPDNIDLTLYDRNILNQMLYELKHATDFRDKKTDKLYTVGDSVKPKEPTINLFGNIERSGKIHEDGTITEVVKHLFCDQITVSTESSKVTFLKEEFPGKTKLRAIYNPSDDTIVFDLLLEDKSLYKSEYQVQKDRIIFRPYTDYKNRIPQIMKQKYKLPKYEINIFGRLKKMIPDLDIYKLSISELYDKIKKVLDVIPDETNSYTEQQRTKTGLTSRTIFLEKLNDMNYFKSEENFKELLRIYKKRFLTYCKYSFDTPRKSFYDFDYYYKIIIFGNDRLRFEDMEDIKRFAKLDGRMEYKIKNEVIKTRIDMTKRKLRENEEINLDLDKLATDEVDKYLNNLEKRISKSDTEAMKLLTKKKTERLELIEIYKDNLRNFYSTRMPIKRTQNYMIPVNYGFNRPFKLADMFNFYIESNYRKMKLSEYLNLDNLETIKKAHNMIEELRASVFYFISVFKSIGLSENQSNIDKSRRIQDIKLLNLDIIINGIVKKSNYFAFYKSYKTGNTGDGRSDNRLIQLKPNDTQKATAIKISLLPVEEAFELSPLKDMDVYIQTNNDVKLNELITLSREKQDDEFEEAPKAGFNLFELFTGVVEKGIDTVKTGFDALSAVGSLLSPKDIKKEELDARSEETLKGLDKDRFKPVEKVLIWPTKPQYLTTECEKLINDIQSKKQERKTYISNIKGVPTKLDQSNIEKIDKEIAKISSKLEEKNKKLLELRIKQKYLKYKNKYYKLKDTNKF